MRTLVLGVDSGTQSTKVLVVNARDGAVVGEAARAYELIPGLPARRQGTASPHLARRRRQSHPRRPQKSRRLRRRSRRHRRQRPAARLCPPGQGRRGHPPRQTLVRHFDRRGVRPDHAKARRRQRRHRGPRQRRPARLYRRQDSLAQTQGARKFRPPRHGAAAPRLLEFLVDGQQGHGIRRRQRHRPARREKAPMVPRRPPGHRPGTGAGLAPLDRQRPARRPFAGRHRARTGPDHQGPGQRRRRRQHDGRHRHGQHRGGCAHGQLRHQRHDLRLLGTTGH